MTLRYLNIAINSKKHRANYAYAQAKLHLAA